MTVVEKIKAKKTVTDRISALQALQVEMKQLDSWRNSRLICTVGTTILFGITAIIYFLLDNGYTFPNDVLKIRHSEYTGLVEGPLFFQ